MADIEEHLGESACAGAEAGEAGPHFVRAQEHFAHLVAIDSLRVKYWRGRAKDAAANCAKL